MTTQADGSAASLVNEALRWAEDDPDPSTREELLQLAREHPERLSELMHPPIGFGTAGVRAIVGPGPARMNRAVMRRASSVLAEYVISRVPDARSLPFLIGFDARPTSRELAEEAAGVLLAARLPVRFFEEPVPTPLVAYAMRQLGCSAALMVTASHNPAEYNGFKVYGPDGVQAGGAMEEELATRFAAAPAAVRVPHRVSAFEHAEPVPPSMSDRYLAEMDALRPSGKRARDFAIVYTPLHGVGGKYVLQALSRGGFERVTAVPEQATPDGTFPTVPRPNPEETPAMELGHRLATELSADLVLANDPDADRLAVSVPTASGRWLQLTGNQIGLLLGEFLLRSAPSSPRPLVVSTLVSSPALGEVAAAYGARFERTLTGFKWIARAALDLERGENVRFTFGYEEALGFSMGRAVRDKDGISAALLFAELCAECLARGRSIREHLNSLYARYGLWVSTQVSDTFAGAAARTALLDGIERVIASPPARLGSFDVIGVSSESTRGGPGGASPLVRFDLGEGSEAWVRPSGTEPKLKIYVNVVDRSGGDPMREEPVLAARAEDAGQALLRAIREPGVREGPASEGG